jgi:hypothetical protein
MAPFRDFPNEQTLISSLQFSARDIAVLDVRPDFATVNWTTSTSPAEFLERALELAGGDVSTVTFRYAGEESDTGLTALTEAAARPQFSELCDFIRLDLSATRSYAWQHLDAEGFGSAGGFDVVGFGDDVKELAVQTQPVSELLEVTASEGVSAGVVLDELHRLLGAVPGSYTFETPEPGF